MRETELSTMVPVDALALDQFEEQYMVRVQHKPFDWETGWNHILQIALYQKGPDVSEVGSTWLENLSSMRALRTITRSEFLSLGAENILPSAWPPDDEGGKKEYNSIPWTLDTRMVHYRRDALARAGIKEEGAFASPEAFHDTLARLSAAGYPYPFVMATGGLSLHNMASWVWGRGGHFRSPDNRRVTLVEPEARRGLEDFFSLVRYMDPVVRSFEYPQADNWYFEGRAPVLFSGQWVTNLARFGSQNILDEVKENTWHASPPGIPYLGSTHIVLWKHSMLDNENFDLIRHLTGVNVSKRIFERGGTFPTRQDILSQPPFSKDPRVQVVVECLKRGRQFRSGKLWAGVEMRLSDMVDKLWADLFDNSDLIIADEVEKRVSELARRLEKTLLAN